MSQTLTSLLVHAIFSTKDRLDMIAPEIEPRLYGYLGSIARKQQSRLLDAGGTANHIHLLISRSKNIALSDLMGELKRGSSKWMKEQGSQFSKFQWQDGYGGFSIGASQIANVESYLAKQKHHHRKTTFQEEFIEFLKKYEIGYNEKYLWRLKGTTPFRVEKYFNPFRGRRFALPTAINYLPSGQKISELRSQAGSLRYVMSEGSNGQSNR